MSEQETQVASIYLDASTLVSVISEQPGFEYLHRRIRDHPVDKITSVVSIFEAVTSLAGDQPTDESLKKAKREVLALLDVYEAKIAPLVAANIHAALDHYLSAVATNKFVGGGAPFILGSSFAKSLAIQTNSEILHNQNPLLD